MDARPEHRSLPPRRSAAFLVLLCAFGAGCGAAPGRSDPEAPDPNGERAAPITLPMAPPELAALSIYVHRMSPIPQNEDDRYDYQFTPAYTEDLRAAFQGSLARAGFRVVLDRRTAADVVAIVHEQWMTRGDGVATMTLRANGRDLDRATVVVPIAQFGDGVMLMQQEGADGLVAALIKSQALRGFAALKAANPNNGPGMVATAQPPIGPVGPVGNTPPIAVNMPSPPPGAQPPRDGGPWVRTMGAGATTFEDAVRDAADARQDEVSTRLVPIIASNTKLSFRTEIGKRQVLMVTWTSWSGYDAYVGKTTTLEREVWTTPAPYVQEFCRGKNSDMNALNLRLRQLLGLPANDQKDRFVEIWVETKDLFRPCPDPEITDQECSTESPKPERLITISAEHTKWFDDLKSRSYGENGYPWTRLGYTYDWSGAKEGLSEFVIRKGAEIEVKGVAGTSAYCSASALAPQLSVPQAPVLR